MFIQNNNTFKKILQRIQNKGKGQGLGVLHNNCIIICELQHTFAAISFTLYYNSAIDEIFISMKFIYEQHTP